MKYIIFACIATVAFAFVSFGVLPNIFATESISNTLISVEDKLVGEKDQTQKNEQPNEPKEEVLHLETPVPLKAIYMTSWVASTPSLRESLFKLIDDTELNSVVIDIKDDTGKVAYQVSDPNIIAEGAVEVRIRDLKELIANLHERDIYVIGRVAVFQDPFLAPKWQSEAVMNASTGGIWKDRKGLSWIDAGSQKYWDYTVAIARDAYNVGFDEINFDYVRYPTDGKLSDIVLPRTGQTAKAEKLAQFFKYLNEKMDESGIPSSADVFGLVTTATDDMSIGQILEDALAYFDYVCPMVYPSHYADGSYGYADPNEHPYEIVKTSMTEAVRRAKAIGTIKDKLAESSSSNNAGDPNNPTSNNLASTTTSTANTAPVLSATDYFAQKYDFKIDPKKLRPWLQDFDYGADYSAEDVRAQIKATYDSGLDSWLLWNAGNKYTASALQ